MNSLFIDTSGWASLFISTQPYYHQAEQHFRLSLKQQKKLYTTKYILAELVDLLNSPLRVSRSRLFEIIDDIKYNYYPDMRSVVNALQAYKSFSYPIVNKTMIIKNCVHYDSREIKKDLKHSWE
jgi:predicted nucleic-acid-binding protein